LPVIEQHPDIPTADGAMNGFLVHPGEGGRVGVYQAASAERHWERLFDLFGRRLVGAA
jgi:hypothetical protein